MNNSIEKQNDSSILLEQQIPLKETQPRSLTPEQQAKAKENSEILSKAMIEGLHQDNLEIFGEDYIKSS